MGVPLSSPPPRPGSFWDLFLTPSVPALLSALLIKTVVHQYRFTVSSRGRKRTDGSTTTAGIVDVPSFLKFYNFCVSLFSAFNPAFGGSGTFSMVALPIVGGGAAACCSVVECEGLQSMTNWLPPKPPTHTDLRVHTYTPIQSHQPTSKGNVFSDSATRPDIIPFVLF